VVVEGGPHGLTWTHAEKVNRELLNFLGQRNFGEPKGSLRYRRVSACSRGYPEQARELVR